MPLYVMVEDKFAEKLKNGELQYDALACGGFQFYASMSVGNSIWDDDEKERLYGIRRKSLTPRQKAPKMGEIFEIANFPPFRYIFCVIAARTTAEPPFLNPELRKYYTNLFGLAKRRRIKSLAIAPFAFDMQFVNILRAPSIDEMYEKELDAAADFLAEDDCMEICVLVRSEPSYYEMMNKHITEFKYIEIPGGYDRKVMNDIYTEKIAPKIDPQERMMRKMASTVSAPKPPEPVCDMKKLSDILRGCGLSQSELAKRADIDKGTVTKIINHEHYRYRPNVETVIALAIAMELSKEERKNFIECAGYIYPVSERDKFVEELLSEGITDIYIINQELENHRPKLRRLTKDKLSETDTPLKKRYRTK